MAFFRIKAPRHGVDSAFKEAKVDEEVKYEIKEVKDEVKTETGTSRESKRNSGVFGQPHSGSLQKKKQKLGDVLGSFM